MQLFLEGKIDAFLGFPTEPQLPPQHRPCAGRGSAVNRSGSQYFCCMLAGIAEGTDLALPRRA